MNLVLYVQIYISQTHIQFQVIILIYNIYFAHMISWMYLPTSKQEQDMTQGQFFSGVEQVFHLQDQFVYQGQRAQSTLLFAHGCGENS